MPSTQWITESDTELVQHDGSTPYAIESPFRHVNGNPFGQLSRGEHNGR
jgi:hypothetical protein